MIGSRNGYCLIGLVNLETSELKNYTVSRDAHLDVFIGTKSEWTRSVVNEPKKLCESFEVAMYSCNKTEVLILTTG